jgi:hypothetical protein
MAMITYEENCSTCGATVVAKNPNLNYLRPHTMCAKCGSILCVSCGAEDPKCPVCGYRGPEKTTLEETGLTYLQRMSGKRKDAIFAALRSESMVDVVKAVLPIHDECLNDLDARLTKLEKTVNKK